MGDLVTVEARLNKIEGLLRSLISRLNNVSAGSGHTIQEEGSNLAQRTNLNFIGTAVTAADDAGNDATTITITGSSGNSFETIAVSGQSDVVAESATDTLTLVAGSNVTITTTAATDTITIAATDTNSNGFETIAVSGQSNVVADSATDTLTFAAGSNVTITTNATTDTVTIASAAPSFTKVINMMQHVMLDASGDAFFEPYSLLATNDLFQHLILRCGANNAAAPTVKAGFYGAFRIPPDYNTGGTVTCIVQWTSTLTSGDVVFDLDYRAIGGDDTESLDQASYQESLTVTDTAPSAANERQTATMTFTASNLAADDTLEFFFGRDGAAGGDTLAGSAIVHEVIFKYTT